MTDDELRELLAKAAPEPWDIGYDNDTGPDDDYFFEWVTVGPARLVDRSNVDDADARLIALAPTLAARALADAEKIARLTEALRKLDYWFDVDQEVLDAMGDAERADHHRQHDMIRSAIDEAAS